MNPSETVSLDERHPSEGGWISLAPVHLLPWILLGMGFLQDLIIASMPFGFRLRMFAGWGFTLLRWGLGGMAMAAAYQARSERNAGSLRQAAFGLAVAVLGLRICLGLGMRFLFRSGLGNYSIWAASHALLVLLALGALILLLTGSQEDAGGPFDGAVTALVLASGLGWIGLPVLAIAAMKDHPLLAAMWQSLRTPKTALESGWLDGQDEALRLKNLGACALACAVASLALIAQFFMNFSRAGSFGTPTWWISADLAAAALASLLLSFHVLRSARRSGHREGRGPALAAILLVSIPLLLLLTAAVLLVLILTDVIHFRLF